MKICAKVLPSINELNRLLIYDPETGEICWRIKGKGIKYPGSRAGCINGEGYRSIQIGGQNYPEHRIAWKIATGHDPAAWIDHVNGIRDDNRISNLRTASSSQNCQNSKKRSDNRSGIKGVHRNHLKQKWVAQIRVGGKLIHLGSFHKITDAAAAYSAASARLHKEFSHLG